MNFLKGVHIPAAFTIVCFCFCKFRTVSYCGSCVEQVVVDFTQSMLVFVLPLRISCTPFKDILSAVLKLFVICTGIYDDPDNCLEFLTDEPTLFVDILYLLSNKL